MRSSRWMRSTVACECASPSSRIAEIIAASSFSAACCCDWPAAATTAHVTTETMSAGVRSFTSISFWSVTKLRLRPPSDDERSVRESSLLLVERCGRRDAVLLEDLPVLHDEADLAQRVDVGQRITGDGNHVGRKVRA